jgi:glycosyltransferase involved in cell wall biosynthesis
MMSEPLITVLMPVRDARAYIDAAIDSILGQTEPSFVLMVIDDGSTDGSVDRVLARSDRRIFLVNDGQRRGLIDRLNWGLDHATSDYVARMDADDVSAPDRLSRQLRYMRDHPEIGICGSWYRAFNGEATLGEARLPEDHASLVAMMLFGSPFAHGSVMMRRDVLNAFQLRYAPHAVHAEDYDLWERASAVTRLANVPEMLYAYRVHGEQISHRFRVEQRRQADSVRARLLSRLNVPYTAEQLKTHCEIAAGTQFSTAGACYSALRWMRQLRKSVTGPEDVRHAVIQSCGKMERQLLRQLWRRIRHFPAPN